MMRPLLGSLILLVTSATSAVAAPIPFDPAPAFDLEPLDLSRESPMIRAALASLQRRDTERAVAAALAVLRNDPGSAIAYEVIGSAAMLKQDWKEAERALSEAIRLDPRSVTALTKLGSTLLAANDVARATEMFRKALAISPTKGLARRHLAYIELRQGRLSQAIGELQEGVNVSRGNDAETKFVLAVLHHEMRQSGDAERLVTEIVKAEPAWQPAQVLLGIVKLDQGQIDGALPLLQKVTRQVSKAVSARLYSAVTLRANGQSMESSKLLEQLTREKPDWALAHFEFGETLLALKQFARAEQAYAAAKRASGNEHLGLLAGVAELYAWQAGRQPAIERPAAPTKSASATGLVR